MQKISGMREGCYPLSSLTSIMFMYPVLMVFKDTMKHDYRHKILMVYLVYVTFLSILHSFFFEYDGILAFLDRWFARLGIFLFFICMVSTKYYFGAIEKICIIIGIIFYFLCMSPIFDYKYTELFHLIFRYCIYVFLTIFLHKFFNLKSSLYKHIKTLTILYVACIVIVFTLFYKLGLY